jgi:hypothetical protein
MNPKTIKIARRFVYAYTKFKSAENVKNAVKNDFFTAITEELKSGPLARRTIKLPDLPWIEQESWVKQHHPGWILINSVKDRGIIKQDPSLMKFSIVIDGKVWGRNSSESGPSLDEDRLKAEDPQLYKKVTRPVRILKDQNKLTTGQWIMLQEYMTPGPVTVKVAPPRKVQPEDLENQDGEA